MKRNINKEFLQDYDMFTVDVRLFLVADKGTVKIKKLPDALAKENLFGDLMNNGVVELSDGTRVMMVGYQFTKNVLE